MLNDSKAWWAIEIDEIIGELAVNPEKGLSESEVKERLKKYGLNLIAPPKSLKKYYKSDKTDYEMGRVLRDGVEKQVYVAELVPGDIILFSDKVNLAEKQKEKFRHIIDQGKELPFIGEQIGADARLLESEDLSINETVLTGMATPSKKNASIGTLPEETHLADSVNMVFSSTSISSGSGKAVVVNTGKSTQVGRIAVPMSDI